MPTVLLIDDDEALAPPLATYLKRFDFELLAAPRPTQGLARLAQGGIDAVILDVMLPEMDGFEVCRRIRADATLADVPVLMLTARGELSDKVVGLELGADDYLPKPFEPRELAARLATILRRRKPATPAFTAAAVATAVPAVPAAPTAQAPADTRVLRFERLLVDAVRREVRRDGEPVPLTGAEFELLLLLAGEAGRVFSRDEILNRLRGHDALDLHTRAVDILVSRLRRKLEPLDCIRTLRNAGYVLAGAPG